MKSAISTNTGINNIPNYNAAKGDDLEVVIYYYHPDHLGSNTFVTDMVGLPYQMFVNLPFGETMAEQTSTRYFQNPYKFNGKELDAETGLYYYSARYYDPRGSLWLGVDPLAEKNNFESPYVFVHNNPLIYIDPDGRDGILVVFPDYKVDTETRLGKQPLGHAGVLLIDNKTGYTRYYEYGRYATTDGTKGKVRNVRVSKVVIDPETGKPTQESLNKVLGQLSKASGQNGRIQGAYVEGDFDKMNDYAQGKLNESDPNHPDYNKDREPYSLTGNNCGTFSCDVLKQDPEAKKKAPWIFIPTPDNMAEEYQDNFPKVDYNSKTKTTTSDIYKKED
ncbi:MAG: RHS repeat-associated core domain-containing protein [Bacteroidales bacterium]|nr:RHS repeat-associated core domain-containing protein [Bacteroidales bacterium]